MFEYFKDKNDFGKFMILIGVITLVPLLMLPFYPNEIYVAWVFVLPGFTSIVLGLLVCTFTKNRNMTFTWKKNLQSSSITVLFAWNYGFLASAMPFMLSGELNFIGALFESVSGWTTTGHSVINVLEVSHIMLFHRALIQFIGGFGFVMMMVMVVKDRKAMSLFHAEGHTDNIMPNIKRTARVVFLMFVGFAAAGTIAYRAFGMPIFDGICHSMSALSTAGFSTQVNSIGSYNSLGIEVVTEVLMLIGIVNFALLMKLLRGRFKEVARVTEIRFGAVVIGICLPLITFALIHFNNMTIGESIRKAIFNGISAISTTGYSTSDFSSWPTFAMIIMIAMMIIGGGIGSTAGGIKLIRAYLILKILKTDLKKRLSPKRRILVPTYYRVQGKDVIDDELIKEIYSFVAFYVSILLLGALGLTLTENCTMTEALFDYASSIGGVGLTTGITGPNSSNGTLIIEMIGMILGRLEIFIVLIGLVSIKDVAKQKIRSISKNVL